jgi:hypothetical protein
MPPEESRLAQVAATILLITIAVATPVSVARR